METTKAVLRGPDPYFGPDCVLYSPGQVVPDVPVDQISTEDSRDEVVKVQGVDGRFRDRIIQRRVQFRPLKDSSD